MQNLHVNAATSTGACVDCDIMTLASGRELRAALAAGAGEPRARPRGWLPRRLQHDVLEEHHRRHVPHLQDDRGSVCWCVRVPAHVASAAFVCFRASRIPISCFATVLGVCTSVHTMYMYVY